MFSLIHYLKDYQLEVVNLRSNRLNLLKDSNLIIIRK